MRKAMFILALFLLSVFAAPHLVLASTEDKIEVVVPVVRLTAEHKVRPGNSLWRIYRQHYKDKASKNKIKALAYWNNIKKPSLVFPGQKIQIFKPLVLIQDAVRVNPTTIHLCTAIKKAIKQFKKSLNVAGIKMSLPPDLFDQIHEGISLSNERHILNGEVAASVTFKTWAQGWTIITAKEEIFGPSIIIGLGDSYGVRAVYADQCKNVYLQLVQKPKPVAKLKLKKKLLPLLQKKQLKKVALTKAASKPQQSDLEFIFYMDCEAWLYAGIYQGVQDANSHDWSSYYGGNISFFPGLVKTEHGMFRVGPAFQYVGWQGEAGRSVDYSGDMILWGGEGQFITGNTKTQVKVYSGMKRSEVFGQGFPYEAQEEARIIAIEPAHTWWYDDGNPWFNVSEVGARLELASGETKDAYMNGKLIPKADDPVNDQSYLGVRAKTEIYQGKYLTPTAELTGGYRGFDKAYHLEPRAGVKFYQDVAEVDLSYNLVEHNQNDMAGVHLIVNASHGVNMLVKWLGKVLGLKADTTPTFYDREMEDHIMGPSMGGGMSI